MRAGGCWGRRPPGTWGAACAPGAEASSRPASSRGPGAGTSSQPALRSFWLGLPRSGHFSRGVQNPRGCACVVGKRLWLPNCFSFLAVLGVSNSAMSVVKISENFWAVRVAKHAQKIRFPTTRAPTLPPPTPNSPLPTPSSSPPSLSRRQPPAPFRFAPREHVPPPARPQPRQEPVSPLAHDD